MGGSTPETEDGPGAPAEATPEPAPLLELRDGLPLVVDTGVARGGRRHGVILPGGRWAAGGGQRVG